MIRSLRTAVSGLKSNQTKMDVVGNNISNVNTVAYKRSRTAFTEVLGQEQLGVGRTAGGTGINPSYVGLGVSVGSIDKNWSQGAIEHTGVGTDLALSGDGFFIARAKDRKLLTRAGNFTLNRDGELVTNSGLNVQGWSVDTNGNPTSGTPIDIKIDLNMQTPAKFTDAASVGGNLSAELPTGSKQSISTVLYDEQGKSHSVIIDFTKSATPDTWTYTMRYSDPARAAFGLDAADLDGDGVANNLPVQGAVLFKVNGSIDTITSGPGAPTLPVTPGGATSFDLTWDAAYVGGTPPPTLAVGFDGLTQHAGSSTVTFRDQNGYAAGALTGYSINPDGIVELNFTNGEQLKVFQLAVANVNNPNGLDQQGENYYQTTSASGDMQLGRAGRDVRTSVVSGSLEMSNVDLATEFTEMIVSQRGYQAAARIITTSDEMLQETMQLKR